MTTTFLNRLTQHRHNIEFVDENSVASAAEEESPGKMSVS